MTTSDEIELETCPGEIRDRVASISFPDPDVKNLENGIKRSPEEPKEEKKKLEKLTKKKILTIAALAYGNFSLGTIYAILAPFFPHEAEKKEVTPTEYGVIFGIFEVGQFIFAPLIGLIIPSLSPKFFLVIGLFITGYCNIFFSLLEWSPHGMIYFVSAFLLRLFSSIGSCAFLTSSLTVIAIDFNDRVSTLYATTEMCFGIGMIFGPSIGGFLFEVGGFYLPFLTAGVMSFVGAGMVCFWLPDQSERPEEIPSGDRISVLDLLPNIGIMVNISITFAAFLNVGFNDATLEHHIRDFTTLKPSAVGGIFLVSGLIYAICSQGWGVIINRSSNAHPYCLIGFIFSLLFFLLSGPMHPLPLEPSITLIIVSQAMYGISMGSQLVGSFTQGLRHIIKSGFPDNMSSLSAMSSLYQSACALGYVFLLRQMKIKLSRAAIGPIIGGYLMDNYGYRKACIVMVAIQVLMILVIIVYGIYEKSCSSTKKQVTDTNQNVT